MILIGEMRDRETMDYAIAFAETGHLCLATLHANSANQALDRIINFFPEERRPQLLMDLSLNLRAMVSQRLIPMKEGKGRVAAVEIMLNSPLIADLIFKGEVHEIKEIMKKSRELGMQTFDQPLFDLYETRHDQLRGRAAQRRLGQRPAADDQAALQGSEEPRHHPGHRAPRYREVAAGGNIGEMIPNVLSIAGVDPSGGAGILADLKTFAALGAYGCGVVAALTAQNTRAVTGIHAVPPTFSLYSSIRSSPMFGSTRSRSACSPPPS